MQGTLGKLRSFCKESGEPVAYRKLEANVIKEHLRNYPNDEDRELLGGPGGLQYLLGKPNDYVRSLWRWAVTSQLSPRLSKRERALFLSMHAVLYSTTSREHFSWIDLDYLKRALRKNNLKLQVVLTLIDDWYDVYRRLSAHGQLFAPVAGEKTTPAESFVENVARIVSLLEWRSKEILTSEAIARYFRVPHYVVAVKHPKRVVFDLIFTAKLPVYVSHPITQVRELEAMSDPAAQKKADSMKEEIQGLTNGLRESKVVIPFSPTAIDELIIARQGGHLLPRFRDRWLPGDLADLLFIPPPPEPANPLDPRKFFTEGTNGATLEVCSAVLRVLWELTRRQVSSRDRKLVEQGKCLIVYRPYFNGHFSRGVEVEIKHRTRLTQYKVANGGARQCFVLIPDGDLAELRLKKLGNTLKASAVVTVGDSLPDDQVAALSSSLLKNTKILDGLAKGNLAAASLMEDQTVQALGFRDMPPFDDTMGEENRLRQRRWLARKWGQVVKELNEHDPVRDVLQTGDKRFTEVMAPADFIARIELDLKNRLPRQGRGVIKADLGFGRKS